MILGKEQILAQRLPTEIVTIPWMPEAQIIVRALPHHVIERVGKHSESWRAFMFVNALVDEHGNRLYTDEDAGIVSETVDRSLIALVVRVCEKLTDIPAERTEAIKKNWPIPAVDDFGESQSLSDTPTQT